jgi:hypothetical protein
MATPEEAVWNALLEMEPSLTRMEEPDVPSLTGKFFDELRVRGFVLVAVADLEAASSAHPLCPHPSPAPRRSLRPA